MTTIIIIILIIIAISFFSFTNDRDKMLQADVDRSGGMLKKYDTLVQSILRDPQARVTKVERDQVIITMWTAHTVAEYFIMETINSVEITWNANLGGLMGRQNKTWSFSKTTSQTVMLDTIREYMERKFIELYGGQSR